jgi:hypothetical protein
MAQLGVFIMPIVTVQSWLTDPMFGFISCGPMYVWNMVCIPYDGLYPMVIPIIIVFNVYIPISFDWIILNHIHPLRFNEMHRLWFSCSTTSSNSKLRYTHTYYIIMAVWNPLLTTCASWFQAKSCRIPCLSSFLHDHDSSLGPEALEE